MTNPPRTAPATVPAQKPATPSSPSDDRPRAIRRPYEPPALRQESLGDLLEILGPAQAGYGGPGFAF
jgi:hypothetical protein